MIKVAINGFGRIGRLSYRIGLLKHAEEIDFVAINTSGSMDTAGWAYFVNYDSMYRKFEKSVVAEEVKKPDQATDEDPLIGYLKVESKKNLKS